MKSFKKFLAVLLATVIMFVGLPITISAETDESMVYLSDIYYAYSTYLDKSKVLDTYNADTIEIMYRSLENYLNDPSFDITSIKTALAGIANMADFVKLMMSSSDYFSNVIKEEAMEEANNLFLQNLLNDSTLEGAGVAEDMADKVVNLCETFEEYTAYVTGKELEDAQILESAMDFLKNSKILSETTSENLGDILSAFVPNIKTASGIASIGGDMIKLGKTLMIATMMEDVRLTIVKDILNHSTYGSTLYKGMKKLYDQIEGGFGAYVYDQYVVGGMLEKLGESVVDKIIGSALQNTSALYSVVALILNISVELIFPNIPDLNEIMLQMVLTDYASGMQTVVTNFDNKFSEASFLSKDIKTHQKLTRALQVVTDMALEKTEPLTVNEEDEDRLNYLIKKYSGKFDLYSSVMEDVRNIIIKIEPEDRIINYYDEWKVNENVDLVNASDFIEYNKLYCTNGVFNGSIKVWENYKLSVPKNEKVAVGGNVSLTSRALLDNCGILDISGNLTNTYHYEAVYNDGILSVGGNLDVEGFVMTEESATVYVKGNVRTNNYLIENGTIVLNGEEQQELYKVKAHNITVTNPKGILYVSDVYVSGHYQLNGNPLDNGGWGYYTIINSNEVTFDENSDFKNVRIVGEKEMPLNFKGNLYVYQDASFIIPEGKTVTVDGDIIFDSESSILTNNGELIVTGSILNYTRGILNNNGKIEIGGNLAIKKINMSLDTAVMDIKGNISFWYSNSSNITGGTVILSGTEQQSVSNLNLHNITVTNPKGILYNSDIYVSGHYQLNGNPLDNGGYYTVINSNEVTFDENSDFKNVRIVGEKEMPLNFKGNLYVYQDASFIIPEGKTVTVDGDIIFNSQSSILTNNGELIVTGSINNNTYGILNNNGKIEIGGNFGIRKINMSLDTAVMDIKGYINFWYSNSSNITGGTVILSGTEQQSVSNLNLHNITVTNPNGILYNSDLYVSGHYQLNGNPLDNRSYYTVINSNEVTFDENSDFKNIAIKSNIENSLNVKGNVRIWDNKSALTIPNGKKAVIDGNLEFGIGSELINNGDLTVTGILGNSYSDTVHNNGILTVVGNLRPSYFNMNGENSILFVGGNMQTTPNISNGRIVFNGKSGQKAYSADKIPVIVIENKSDAGVEFMTAITPKLFISNGNKYTLYAGGKNTVFADYDGDLITDEKDDNPEIFSSKNYCETLCDITADGKTNVLDFIRMKKNTAKGEKTDINLDGNADVYDMTFLQKTLLGIFQLTNIL